ncbi:helix-turn-helix domain-containing protein [Tepidicaulis sp.]|uniref:helix-turn-helix transcriptional regulator n=1 Tax=Tepidicaulis sp. TaxID=1920809 RepID=UPI003B5B8E3F
MQGPIAGEAQGARAEDAGEHIVSSSGLLVISKQPLLRQALGGLAQRVLAPAHIVEAGSLGEARGVLARGAPVGGALFDVPARASTEPAFLLGSLLRAQPTLAFALFLDRDDFFLIPEFMALGVSVFLPKHGDIRELERGLRAFAKGGAHLPDYGADPEGELRAGEDEGFGEAPPGFAAQAGGSALASLTPRQHEVLHHLAAGRSNQEIAERLGIALATVKLHVNAILAGLNVRNRTEAAIIAHRAGLRDDEGGEIPDGAGA